MSLSHDAILRDSPEALAARIAQAIPGFTWLMDLKENRYLFVNDGLGRILGLTREEIVAGGPNLILSIMHPDDLQRVLEKHQAATEKYAQPTPEALNHIHQDEYRLRDSKGNWRWVRTSGVIFSRDPDGSIRTVLGVGLETTEQKEAEARRQLEVANQLNHPVAFLTMSLEVAMQDLTQKNEGDLRSRVKRACELLSKAHKHALRLSALLATR